jgi:hypothetical protein
VSAFIYVYLLILLPSLLQSSSFYPVPFLLLVRTCSASGLAPLVCLAVCTVAGFLVVAVVPVFGLPDVSGIPAVQRPCCCSRPCRCHCSVAHVLSRHCRCHCSVAHVLIFMD